MPHYIILAGYHAQAEALAAVQWRAFWEIARLQWPAARDPLISMVQAMVTPHWVFSTDFEGIYEHGGKYYYYRFKSHEDVGDISSAKVKIKKNGAASIIEAGTETIYEATNASTAHALRNHPWRTLHWPVARWWQSSHKDIVVCTV